MTTILVGVDGRPASRAPVVWAADYALACHARVVAVCAQSGVWVLDAFQVDTDRLRSTVKEDLSEDWCKPLAEAGVDFETIEREGGVASELARVAEETNATLIVIGHHVRRGHPHHHLNSVVREVLERAGRPVVVVPHFDALSR